MPRDDPSELHWRGLTFVPAGDAPDTLQSGRWKVSLRNRSPGDRSCTAVWQNENARYASQRDTPLEALNALARYLEHRNRDDISRDATHTLVELDLARLSFDVDGLEPIVWRGITLAPHSRGVWLSADRLWKLTQIVGDPRSVAFLQLEIDLIIVESGDTPKEALERLAVRAAAVAKKLNGMLEQAPVPAPAAEGDVISGAHIKSARVAAGLTITSLAWELDMIPAMLERLESESHPTLSLHGWVKLSEILPSLLSSKLLEGVKAAIRKSEST